MKVDAWHLPWGKESVPHALLDIIRGCNITCNACYNFLPQCVKSLPEIEHDLTTMLSQRHLEAVSLVGGEVFLHPNLCDIVKLLKTRGLSVHIFTNGVLLDDRKLSQLKDAGLDMIFVHIDGGQTRPDLPLHPSRDQLRNLWEEKTTLVARHGIDVGLTMTAFEERLTDVLDIVTYTVNSVHVNYLLVTLFRNTGNILNIHGDLHSGLHGTLRDPSHKRTDTLTNMQISQYLHDKLRLRPFAYLGSNMSADDPRWLSYLVAAGRNGSGTPVSCCIKASMLEKACLALMFLLSGKYPMYRRQNTLQLIVQLTLNAFLGGDLRGNMRFLAQCCRPNSRLGVKRLLFQCPADIKEDGSVVHCLNCPDAVVKEGKLVPVCISDVTDVNP